MKNIYIFSILVLAFLAGLFIINSQYQPKTSSGTTKSNIERGTQTEFTDINFNNQQIRIASFKVGSPAKISLIPNFDDKATAFEAIDKYNCKDLINGGFYSQGNFPIGLFVTDDKKIGNFTQNLLFNGFFKILKNETPIISAESSTDNYRIALQSGPILFQNGFPLKLRIIDDKPERRAVVALTKNEVYFIIFYDKNSVYIGPYLADLPELVRIFSQKKSIQITDALNLDGGTASTFHSGNISLSELSPVGSFFCIKN